MKKFSLVAVILLGVFACNSPATKQQQPTSVTEPAVVASAEDGVSPAVAANPDYIKGLALVQKSDCLGCHRVVETSVGPAYAAIAAKYEPTPSNITLLAKKIMEGGQGNWGEVPMAAHTGLAKEDAEQMVKYILLLKDAK